jgi:Flp pilus assembly protein TadG
VSGLLRLSRALGFCGDCGGALIETALAAPLLSLLLLGAAEFGLLDYEAIEVSNAAKAGVEYGSSSPSAAVDTTGIQTAAQNDAANILTRAGRSNLTATPSWSYACAGAQPPVAPSGTPLTCPGNAAIETILTVHTTATFVPLIHIPGFVSPITIYGQATQKVMR